MKPGPLICAPQFSSNNIKKGINPVLALFEPNCARHNSLARTFRIELTRQTTPVETPEEDKTTLKDIIEKQKDRIIEALTTVTCLKNTETPHATAEAIYAEIAEKFARL